MIIKIQCRHCYHEFEDEGLDHAVLCPACGNATPLKANPTVQPANHPAPLTKANHPALQKMTLETYLERIGKAFLWLGILGAIGCGGGALISTEHDPEWIIPFAAAMVAALLQGIALHGFFKALAEIIRQLRKK